MAAGCSVGGGVVGVSMVLPSEIDIGLEGRDAYAPLGGILTALSAAFSLGTPLGSPCGRVTPLSCEPTSGSLLTDTPFAAACSAASDSLRLIGLDD